jgi:hypothetical protein
MDQLQIEQSVMISISGEVGMIIGKAEYRDSNTVYQVHYKDATGVNRTEWYAGSQLQPA